MESSFQRFSAKAPYWDTPVMIESHLNGVRTKRMNPHTPVTHYEIIADAIRCWDAGATAIHTHNSSFDLLGEAAFEDYMIAWAPILRERPEMIWYPTTCNNQLVGPDQTGLEHVDLLNRHANVQIAVLDTGISQFATDEDGEGYALGRPYGWDLDQVARQIRFCRSRDIAMIWGVYEPGHLRVARHYVDRGLFTKGSNWDFYFVGPYGLTAEKPIGLCGMPHSLDSLYYYLDMISEAKHRLPWFISIWGEGDYDYRPLIRRTIELGGHIKTGLELHYSPNRNPTNLELLQEAQEIARDVGRPLATPDDARRLYGMT